MGKLVSFDIVLILCAMCLVVGMVIGGLLMVIAQEKRDLKRYE